MNDWCCSVQRAQVYNITEYCGETADDATDVTVRDDEDVEDQPGVTGAAASVQCSTCIGPGGSLLW